MRLRSLAMLLLLPVVAGGLAIGAPNPRGDLDSRARGKPELQLDRAGLFRPAHVAECGSVRRDQPMRQERKARANRAQSGSASGFACNATWSD